ncbi:Eco57I restriction-modification methylase domain-containing protein [Nocardia camponoti]|uniref:site-specific DNA-methyltransferase (adenine-specific) n=1 Tax=Nocardia camponoti TaxID=1616106 RepID=A0A917VEG7_9NOCA|nr:restriction endonuclease subunit M [Nocardia camponoti]GGK67585.1 restriction endonuclease subunit M [Nocardia camponoti]
MFDSIANVNDYLSEHWLAEVFPTKLSALGKDWRERAKLGKDSPVKGLAGLGDRYLRSLGELPDSTHADYATLITELHRTLLQAMGFEVEPTELATSQGETAIVVPLLGRCGALDSDAVHILQAVPATDADSLLSEEAELLHPLRLAISSEKTEQLASVSKAVTQLFISDRAPRYLLVLAGATVLLTDAARWSEGRYLAFDIATAVDRRDEKVTGELAHHAGLWSANVLLPNDDGKAALDAFTEDSEKHAIGVSEDLREGLRISIEKIANEVLTQRRAKALPVEGIAELPRELTIQSLRFLYRILFLLFAEARPELGILPVGAPEYGSGYGLDRLREIIGVPLTGRSADGHHLHDSLNLLFGLVNNGHGDSADDGDDLVFEAMRSDLFDRDRTPLIDETRISNRVLQEVLTLLLMSKPSKNKNRQRGYISYAQLGINQLGAVYEGLMSYSGLIAVDDMVEVAKDGNADKGSWLVPSTSSGDYAAEDIVSREDRLTGRRDIVRHAKGNFVFRLSGRDRKRSASYYTPEILTKTVVKHTLAELLTEDTKAAEILEFRICEPALGSGAFLNEAINQLAGEYLTRAQNERPGHRIEPEQYPVELQKVKAYLALHRAYGVDLNATAVELAEVSLWLNVMHRGLRAPWFGLHMRRGNSLIGARRATYDFTALGRAKKSWLKTPPVDRPLSKGPIGDGEIHHFLLPADGWGAVGNAKEARELAPEAAEALRLWRKDVTKRPDRRQLDRLRALARRVERLWELALQRLDISEREVSRNIGVWGLDVETTENAVSREQVESELLDPESPYMRLRLVMDAWCALWFWPLSLSVDEAKGDVPAPPSLNEWTETLESLLGADGRPIEDSGQRMFHETIENFSDLSKIDEIERDFYGMQPVWKVVSKHLWLGAARDIAEAQGFFHWELDFASVFRRGGFDIQVGNPPWVRIEWVEYDVLAERHPAFALKSSRGVGSEEYASVRKDLLGDSGFVNDYLMQLSAHSGASAFLRREEYYPALSGLPANLYRNFMLQFWRGASPAGVSGIVHPDDHFFHDKGGPLRAQCYPRLRRHWGFVNELNLFSEISHTDEFGIHIYGSEGIPRFLQGAKFFHPTTIEGSLQHDGEGESPGLQFPWGGWDLRPHANRIMKIGPSDLKSWARLFEESGTSHLHAKMPAVTSTEQEEALDVLSYGNRMSGRYVWSRCWDEDKIKSMHIAEWKTTRPSTMRGVVLQPAHFGLLNPFAKEPNIVSASSAEYSAVDPGEISSDFVPRTNYSFIASRGEIDSAVRRWYGVAVTDFWRIAWRRRLGQNMARTFQAALFPPGAAHVDTVHTCTVSTCAAPVHTLKDLPTSASDSILTVATAGLWSSIPYDYLVKLSGSDDLRAPMVDRFPLPLDHPALEFLVLRTLRLNCLTIDYAPLWDGLYRAGFERDAWTPAFSCAESLGIADRAWTPTVALRSEFSRRAALVEVDALAALMLGLSADHLALMFRAQFGVLRKYEYEMYFDAKGRRIARDHRTHGAKQQKEDYKLLQAYLANESCGDLLDRYTPFAPDSAHNGPWFYKPDREAEMRSAYADFARRLGLDD